VSDESVRPTDPLSILSLAGGIAALLLAAFSVVPLFGLCTMPLSVISVLTSIVAGIASVVRTTLKPQLDGRLQAIAGLGLSLVWCLVAVLLFMFASRDH
jgi:MFS-type transporter involved in bile tolerance (Atg22 family)